MNNHQYLFYFTKDYQECYEEWENGKLIHSKVTALGTAMFELLSFCQSDELISYALQALSALSKNEMGVFRGAAVVGRAVCADLSGLFPCELICGELKRSRVYFLKNFAALNYIYT